MAARTKKAAAKSAPVRKTASRRKAGAPGHHVVVNPGDDAGRKTSSRKGGAPGQNAPVNLAPRAGRKLSVRKNGGIGQDSFATPSGDVDPELITAIVSLHREHRGLQTAAGDMNRRIKAEERWAATKRVIAAGGSIERKFPEVTDADQQRIIADRARYYDAAEYLEKLRKVCLEELLTATRKLPVAPWVETVPGFALPSLAAIVGEAGDLNNYPSPASLWKRFCLNVTEDGAAARRVKGVANGFVPRRRAEMQVIGYVLEKQRVGTEYRDLYLARKDYELAKLRNAKIKVVPAAKIPKAELKSGKYMAEGQVRNRALRYVEKRLLRNLWRAWTGRGQEYMKPVLRLVA